MNLYRVFCGLLLGTAWLGTGTTQTQANPPKTSVVETEHESSHVGGPVYGYGPFVPYHCNPYIAPYPGYGIMPIPFAYLNMVYGNAYQDYRLDRRPARDYGVPLDVPARKRPSLYPAIPFERSPDELRTDPQRVRFEIEVPFADAVVLFDGAKTKQTGLRRVFTSPPMAYEKEYTVTIVVQWTDQTGSVRMRQRTFTVLAGDTVKHTFIE